MGVHNRFMPLHRRASIEAEIELHLQRVTLLIARLDHADGDCDLEDDDPAGDALDEWGELPASCGAELLPLAPLYGVDQSRGPINERNARPVRAARPPVR